MNQNSEHPKVFISYSWSNKEYEERILTFGKRLLDKGVEVVMDKWDLREGQDKYHFMEKMVNDPTIDKVLVCCDRKYKEKSEDRTGGVGVESTIISEKVYRDHSQTKFVPVIFEEVDGNVCLPTFMSSRIYFDLSDDDSKEFDRLVRTLWGVEIYKKPVLGKKPDFTLQKMAFAFLKVKDGKIIEGYEGLKQELSDVLEKLNIVPPDGDDIDKIEEKANLADKCRDDFYHLMKCLIAEKVNSDQIISFINEINELVCAKIHETKPGTSYSNGKDVVTYFGRFLYLQTVAMFVCQRDYTTIGLLLKSEFPIIGNNPFMGNFNELARSIPFVDNFLNEKKGQRKISYSADRFLSSGSNHGSTNEDIIDADLILFLYSIILRNDSSYIWMPTCSVYSKNYHSITRLFLILNSKTGNPISEALFGHKDFTDVLNKVRLYIKEVKYPIPYGGIGGYSVNQLIGLNSKIASI